MKEFLSSLPPCTFGVRLQQQLRGEIIGVFSHFVLLCILHSYFVSSCCEPTWEVAVWQGQLVGVGWGHLA